MNCSRVSIVCTLSLLALSIGGCGGGEGDAGSAPPPPPPAGPTITAFDADRASYFVGEQARLSFTFQNGTGRLEPDGIAVVSGQGVSTPPLSTPVQYRLIVTDGATTVSRTLDLPVRYQNRLRAIPMPFARGEHVAVRTPADRVLIIGGEDTGNVFPASVYAFNPGSETFTPFAEMATGRVGFVALALYSGDVLVAGGVRAVSGAPRAEVIDHRTGAVTATANAPLRDRQDAAATLLMDGRVFICGGRVTSAAEATAEVYDPDTRSFSLLPGPLQVGRSRHTVTRIDQRRLLIYGGVTADNRMAPPEIYDVVAGTSTLLPAPEMQVRAAHRAITLQDGGILIVGGEDYDQKPIATVLRFDPAASVFTAFATLAIPRTAMAIDRLVDGRLFISGGAVGLLSSDVTQTTEFLTETAQGLDGPPMSAQRRNHSVTRLDSGKLLVLGGLDASLWPLASAEIFE